MTDLPRIIIGATKSGSGKTSISIGITRALARRGLKVQTFKIGPDYLDPAWLSLASTRPCYNLDTWMSGQNYVSNLFLKATRGADIAIIEGVMGLFDGVDSTTISASTAETASLLKAPIVLVLDASGMGASIAPIVLGFSNFNRKVKVKAVVANMIGSDRHNEILKEALIAASAPKLIGGIKKGALPTLSERHLGLAPPILEPAKATNKLDELADSIEESLDLEEIVSLARSAPPLELTTEIQDEACSKTGNRRVTLAVAKDEAFHFYYQDLFDELKRRGVKVEFFSPLHDSSLPCEADMLYLGGGYPELYAEALSKNDMMLESIRSFSEVGHPVYGECGGLIYLSSAVTNQGGERYPLLGLLPAETAVSNKLNRLGYVKVRSTEKSLLGEKGEIFAGHEFHYGELTQEPKEADGWSQIYRPVLKGREPSKLKTLNPKGYHHKEKRILASFAHLHLASHPVALNSFVKTALYGAKETGGKNKGQERKNKRI